MELCEQVVPRPIRSVEFAKQEEDQPSSSDSNRNASKDIKRLRRTSSLDPFADEVAEAEEHEIFDHGTRDEDLAAEPLVRVQGVSVQSVVGHDNTEDGEVEVVATFAQDGLFGQEGGN